MDALDIKACQGKDHNAVNYWITLGQSNGSKGVMFVLYAEMKVCKSEHVNPWTYLGLLGGDIKTAIANARKRVPEYHLNVDCTESLVERRKPNTIPFGKYQGLTVEELFDQDHKYLFWLANNIYRGSKELLAQLSNYKDLAKDMIIDNNKANDKSVFVDLDAKNVERELTIYGVKHDDYWGYYTFSMIDANGVKYVYKGKKELGQKNDVIKLKCKVADHYEAMGIKFNKVKLR